MTKKYYITYLVLSAIICLYLFFETIGRGNFSIDNDFFGIFKGFPSDADVYLRVADEITTEYHRNLGPGLVIRFFDHNYFLIFICQFSIFQYLIYRIYKINNSKLFLLLSSLPILSISTIFPNKEFYTIICLCMLIIFCINKHITWLLLSVIPAIISRPEMAFFVFIFAALYISRKYFIYIFFIIIAGISLLYENIYRMDDYRFVLERGVISTESIALLLDDFSRNYYSYIFIFPFKILASIFDGGWINIVMFNILLFIVIYKGRNKSVIILLVFYLLYSTLPSFPHFRYILPSYIILFFLACNNKTTVN
ncbi:hypothetical protein G6733_01810 [Polynucleobacter paneuropaeus]|nr:hypothetical protein G6733_01810 [Polynucleobacter paneuropaeus]